MSWRLVRLVLAASLLALPVRAEIFRIALIDYTYAPVWRDVVEAMQLADPANQYQVSGIYPLRRLIALAPADQFDFYLPGPISDQGKTLTGFGRTGGFVFYRTDLVLLSRQARPARDAQGKALGPIEGQTTLRLDGDLPIALSNRIDLSVKTLLAGRLVGVVAGRPMLERILLDLAVTEDLRWEPVAQGSVRLGVVESGAWEARTRVAERVLEKLRQSGQLARILEPITGSAKP